MPRYDKYEPYAGGFRAPLAAQVLKDNGFTVYGVGLDADGHVMLGGGQTGIVGVLVSHGAKNAGDIVDVMTSGEIVEFTADGTPDGAAAEAGTVYGVAAASGAVSDSGDVPVGFTVEPGRLVVRFAMTATTAGDGTTTTTTTEATTTTTTTEA